MKLTLICLAIAICGRLAFEVAAQQTVQQPMKYSFHSKYGGDWLTVARHNAKDAADPWDACYTNITSAYVPVVHHLPDGRYEVEFLSEIAKKIDLP
jgi:hypothetical protein